MNKPVSVFLLGHAKEVFWGLCKVEKHQTASGRTTSLEIQLLRAIKKKIELLKTNPFYGDNIPKKQIPSVYDIQNLWRVKLPHFWRMLYTIKGDQVEIICFVMDILNHKEYDKKFGYARD